MPVTLGRPASSPQRRMTLSERVTWADHADRAGIRAAELAIGTMNLEELEPIISRHRAGRARTAAEGVSAGYFRLMFALWHADKRFGVRRLADAPQDFARLLTAEDVPDIGPAMLAEQLADTAEDAAQARFTFSEDQSAVWEWIDRATDERAALDDGILAATRYAISHDIPRPAATRHRKPGALILSGAIR